MNHDFILRCKKYDDNIDWDYTCTYIASSERAKRKFGNCELASINISHEELVAKEIGRKYNIPYKKIVVLDWISRNKKCDKNNELKGIGINMLCNLLKFFVKRNIQYIYLEATTEGKSLSKLTSFYKRFGFISVDNKNPKIMIGKVSDIFKHCKNKSKQKSPVLFRI